MKNLFAGMFLIGCAFLAFEAFAADVNDVNACAFEARPEPYGSCIQNQIARQEAAMRSIIEAISVQIIRQEAPGAAVGLGKLLESQARFSEYRDALCSIVDEAFQTNGVGGRPACTVAQNVSRLAVLQALLDEIKN